MSGLILALLSGLFAGVTVAVGKMATPHVASIVYVLIMSVASLSMTYLWRLLKSDPKLAPLIGHQFRYLCGHSVFSAIAMWTFWEGTKHMDAAIASFSVRIELVFVLIASRIWFRERFSQRVMIGAVFIILGTAIMGTAFNGQWPTFADLSKSSGMWMMVTSGAAFAGAECFANLLAKQIRTSDLVIWRGLILVSIFTLMLSMGESLTMPSLQDIGVIILAAFFGQVLARVCFMMALRKIDLGRASLLSQTEPIVTALVAWLLLGEVMRPVDMVGAVVILGGCLLISLPSLSTQPRPFES